jgi:hypothetical protein
MVQTRIGLFSMRHPASVALRLNSSWDMSAVEVESTMRTILVGPYGLHVIGFVTLAFFLLFLWVFNFTNLF